MTSNRHILIGGAAKVKGRLRNAGKAMVAVCGSLEPRMAGWLSGAPFETVNLLINYGDETTSIVNIGQVDPKHRELPVAVQISLAELQAAQDVPQELERIIKEHTIKALKAVSIKFGLSQTLFEADGDALRLDENPVDIESLNNSIQGLIDSWCEDKNISALRWLLPAWPHNGLTDGLGELKQALEDTRAFARDSLTEEEVNQLSGAVSLINLMIAPERD